MKKLLISLLVPVVFAASCGQNGTVSSPDPAGYAPEAVLYNDWDRAVRIDVDMQNMYVSTPTKIEKPIDLYMSMALALKYNYTRRLITYEDSIIRAGRSPVNRLPEIVSHAGYINDTNSSMSPDLKVAWNMLDISMVYCLSQDKEYKASVAFEESRKVIHNILQETRTLYWKTLTAQRLLPVIDDMTEFMTLEVDDMNAKAKELEKKGEAPEVAQLVKKRQYMEAIKNLSALKRDMETAQTRLASLMGLHPSTEFKLVGSEYGNFDLPKIRNSLADLEWLALSNRPELREHDLAVNAERMKLIIKDFKDPGLKKYKNDPDFYNRLWSKQARELGMSVFEDPASPNVLDMEHLRRQRMTALILSQVYVAWAQYMSAVEDYQINMEIASTSENIAEDFTIADGSKAEKSQLEASRAIEDEVKAFKSYADLQESLGNLYATIGLDAIPYYMLNEKPSKIAVYLRNTLEKWGKGDFMPDNRPYLLNIPAKRPPVNLSSDTLLPDVKGETGKKITVKVPDSALARMDFEGKVISRAGTIDDKPLPKWLTYNEETRTFNGTAMPGQEGTYNLKVYFSDEKGNVAYMTFKIVIKEVYIPSLTVKGQVPGSTATVLKRCVGSNCKDDYIIEEAVGNDIRTSAQ